jgi:hypothetical protein
MDAALLHAGMIQSILMEDLPFLPLYATYTHDTYQNIQYPFEAVPGGVAGFFGVSSLAYPVR